MDLSDVIKFMRLTLRFPWSLHATQCITSLLSFWSICIQSFPQFFTVPSFKMVFFFFFMFFPFFPLPCQLLFPPPPPVLHRGFFHMPRPINYQWSVVERIWLTDLTRAAVHVVLYGYMTRWFSTNTASDSHVHLLQWLWIFIYCVESTNFE